jgi:hypothetical protein
VGGEGVLNREQLTSIPEHECSILKSAQCMLSALTGTQQWGTPKKVLNQNRFYI